MIKSFKDKEAEKIRIDYLKTYINACNCFINLVKNTKANTIYVAEITNSAAKYYKVIKVEDISSATATYTLAPAGMMINAPATMIVPASESLLCILNSKLADYYIRNLGVTRNGGYFEEYRYRRKDCSRRSYY